MSATIPAPVLDAMREWLVAEMRTDWVSLAAAPVIRGWAVPAVRRATDAWIVRTIEQVYPGGVSAFRSDYDDEGRRRCPSCGTLATVPFDPREEEGCCEVCPAVRSPREGGAS